MTTFIEQKDDWVLTLPKQVFPKDFLLRLLELVQLAEISQRNQMTEEQTWQVSEDIKSSWLMPNGKPVANGLTPKILSDILFQINLSADDKIQIAKKLRADAAAERWRKLAAELPDVPEISMDEIVAEVKAVRRERRQRQLATAHAHPA